MSGISGGSSSYVPYIYRNAAGAVSKGATRAGSSATSASRASSTSSRNASTNPYMVAYRNAANQINANYDAQLRQMEADRASYLAGQADARDAWRNQALADYNNNRAQAEKEQTASLDKTNAGYDASARQNYINYMQAQKGLASQLNALGIRGGASESSAIRMNANYGSNVAANESARNTALANLRDAYEKSLFELQSQYTQALNDYDNEYRQRLNSYEDTYNTNRSSTLADKNSALTNAYITAQENKIKYKQERQAADLANYEKSIVGRWKTAEKFDKEIARLKKSKDPNKWQKIRLAQQAKSQLDEGGGSGGGGSYGGGRSYGGSSYGGYSGGDDTTTTAPKSNGNSGLKGKYGSGANVGKAMANAIINSSKSKSGNKSKGSSKSKNSSSNKKGTGRNRRSISRGNGLIY